MVSATSGFERATHGPFESAVPCAVGARCGQFTRMNRFHACAIDSASFLNLRACVRPSPGKFIAEPDQGSIPQ